MSRLSRRIRECETAIDTDRRNMAAATTQLRAGIHRRMSRPSILLAFFGGGLALGFLSGARKTSDTASSTVASPRVASPWSSMGTRLARDVLWPVGISALQVQLARLLGSDTQRR
ncbi:MAG: hypothetical protein L0H73_09975 [Nitrococcus sp.]|nr:hypothetical protein [Nitrococcus sp.]